MSMWVILGQSRTPQGSFLMSSLFLPAERRFSDTPVAPSRQRTAAARLARARAEGAGDDRVAAVLTCGLRTALANAEGDCDAIMTRRPMKGGRSLYA